MGEGQALVGAENGLWRQLQQPSSPATGIAEDCVTHLLWSIADRRPCRKAPSVICKMMPRDETGIECALTAITIEILRPEGWICLLY